MRTVLLALLMSLLPVVARGQTQIPAAPPAAVKTKCDTGEVVIRFALTGDVDFAARNRAAKLLEGAVNRELQGRACMELKISESLYKGTLAIAALQSGSVQMAAPSFDTLGEFATLYRVFDLPFAFRDIFSVQRFQSNAGATLGAALDRNGVQALAFWHEGFKQMTAKKVLVWPRDAAGVKFRHDDGANSAELVDLLRATAQSIAENDTLVALKTGRIEAQISTWERLQADKTVSVQAGVTETNHSYLGYQLVAAKSWWDGLDPALAKSLSELVARISQQANFETVRRERSSKSAVMRSGTIVRALTRKQRRAWQQVAAPIWDRFAKGGSQKIVDAVRIADTAP